MKSFVRKFILSVLFIFLLTEGAIRLLGIKPFPQMEEGNERSEPFEYAGFHPLYGPCPVPGKFRVIFSKDWCDVTHNADSNRITRFAKDTTDYSSLPKLNFYGCSFTWGTGLNDSETYPFLVQKSLQHYNISNKGIFAAGNLISLLQLKNEIDRNIQPAIAIVTYANFHDQRNTFNREWATMIKQTFKTPVKRETKQQAKQAAKFIDTLKFPMARLKDNRLRISYQKLNGNLFPFSKYLAISNCINYYLMCQDEKKMHSNLVSRRIFSEMNVLCKINNIRLIVACLDNDQKSKKMQEYFNHEGIENFSFDVDYERNNEYNQFPDLHPNSKANKLYAQKIVNYLNKHL